MLLRLLSPFLLASMLSVSYDLLAEENKAPEGDTWKSEWTESVVEKSVTASCRTHKSDIKQCKYRFVSDRSVAALSSVILDVHRFKEWAISVVTSDTKTFDDDPQGIYVYTVYDFVGAYDRDAISVYEPQYDQNMRRVKIRFNTVDREVSAEDLRYVRYPLMAGYWQFTDIGNGKTEIEHTNFTLPGGVVQSTLYHLYNIASFDASIDTMHKVAEQASLPEYKDMPLEEVLERIAAASP